MKNEKQSHTNKCVTNKYSQLTSLFIIHFSLFTTYPSSFAWLHSSLFSLHFSLFTLHHIPKLIRLATLFTLHSSLKMLYPHYLFLLTPSLSQQRADGTWTASTLSRSFACRCLQEANSKGQEVPLANKPLPSCTDRQCLLPPLRLCGVPPPRCPTHPRGLPYPYYQRPRRQRPP